MIARKKICFIISAICVVLSFNYSCGSKLRVKGLRKNNAYSKAASIRSNFTSSLIHAKIDPSSFATPNKEVIEHIYLKWNVDFERKVVNGTAIYTFKILAKKIDSIFLDVFDLKIKQILWRTGTSEHRLKYFISDHIKDLGSKLTIELPTAVREKLELEIEYETSPTAVGLQWLTPEQTLGKVKPYMYSQNQPTGARSLLPCQDTPAVKFTYNAIVTHPEDLTLLLAGIRLKSSPGLTTYEQKVPIVSYLIAIAAGDISSRKIGSRSTLWAEKGTLDAAAEEFSETSDFLKIGELICGPYVWGKYDLLLMPPSFPIGGMENPCLTFVSPTLLAGDKSLSDTIAHEIAHSWCGNFVTNVNFEHLWLNEGFTTFVENKIIGRLHGNLTKDFQFIRAVQTLKDTIRTDLRKKPELTKLVINLSNVSPEEGFSFIPYGKGHVFLRYLEDLLGGPELFEKYLRFYFKKFAYQSIVTDDFKASIYEFFGRNYKKELAEIDWDVWLYGEGMPPVIPKHDSTLADVAHKHAKVWIKSSVGNIKEKLVGDNLTSLQKIELLAKLNEAPKIFDLSTEWISLLEKVYELKKTQNSEIRYFFLLLCIKARQVDRIDEILAFANSNYRMKYVVPIFRDMGQWSQARDIAIANFNKVKNQMISSCSNKIATELGLA